jgi:hypothetical protein
MEVEMTYRTQPGTLPHRFVEHLKSLPAGATVTTADMAEVLGQDANSITAWMVPARRHRAVIAERRPGTGRTLFWRLPTEAELAEPEPEPEEEDPEDRQVGRSVLEVRQRIVPATEAAPLVPELAWARPTPPDEPDAPVETLVGGFAPAFQPAPAGPLITMSIQCSAEHAQRIAAFVRELHGRVAA